MKQVIAFADEFGNNSFKFSTESSHFIIASVIVNYEDLDEFYSEVEKIRIKYFQKGEIKSSKVKDNHKRRLLILNELIKLKFNIYSVVVDKIKLYGEGFKYKKSFYKYLNGILYKELYKTFPKLELKVDEHGGNEFMLEFKEYVKQNHIRTLFEGSEFFVNQSDKELGVQVADFIAGTLGYIFDEHKNNEYSYQFLEVISNKIISINHFPKVYKLNEYNESEVDEFYNQAITDLSLRSIFDYLDTVSSDSQQKQDSINFLKVLVRYHESNHYKNYTTAQEFIEHLNVNRENKLSKEQFVNMVGSLRDKGILIGSSREGYKIPTNHKEIKKYVQHGNSIILPLLRRINVCREAILLATNNSLDILDEPEFNTLKVIINDIP
ncbi:DUF3800 domain-containing protein [Elizabethkingia anophelis]|uniref:Protein of uncharacterized function (DUF3800) n=1 Tax=Elizabethkingia anophelis TaxID=1117645 RepID=A0A7Z7LV01_9FLAO|nr:DUF3800 domain-containing protein [Elizabethkingia anophelis]STC96923.1 Protein of uncharacterised function (DUF3800) [Elizabethkingia anophelis]